LGRRRQEKGIRVMAIMLFGEEETRGIQQGNGNNGIGGGDKRFSRRRAVVGLGRRQEKGNNGIGGGGDKRGNRVLDNVYIVER
jgi:hypothetical protein